MNIMNLLYPILLSVPSLILLIVPFRQLPFFSKLRTAALAIPCITSGILLAALLTPQLEKNGLSRLLCSLIFVSLTALLMQFTHRTKVFINLFIIFFIKNYLDLLILISRTVRITFIENGGKKDDYFYVMILLLVSFPSMFLLFQRFLAPTIIRTQQLSFWRYLWILPCFYYAMYRLSVAPRYVDISGACRPLMDYLPPFWVVNVCFSYLIIFKVMGENLESSSLKEQLKSAQFLNEMQKEQYRLMQNSVAETRKNRHDMNHQFIVIQGYLLQGQTQKAQQYIQECLDYYASTVEQFCDNYAANSIIRYYAAMAEHYQIPFNSSIALPEQLPLSEIDFCTILGNLLLNAIEACIRQTTEEKYIYLYIGEAGASMLAITLRNTYNGEIHQKGELFFSSKREGIGIGTASIRSLVKKYQGILKFTHADGIFEASILLVTHLSKDISR